MEEVWLKEYDQVLHNSADQKQTANHPTTDLEANHILMFLGIYSHLNPFCNNVNATIKDIMEYVIPNNCAVMHLGQWF